MDTADFDRKSRKWLLLIGVVGLALRLGWGQSRPASDEALAALPDQVEYLSLGRNLLQHEYSFFDPRFAQKVYAFRMPGYPLLIAACGGNVRAVRLVQALLDTSTIWATFLLCRLLLGKGRRTPALFAAAIVAVDPLLIYFSALLLSESLFVAMLTWGMVLLIWGFRSQKAGGACALGLFKSAMDFHWLAGPLLLALAVLVRPSAGVLPLLLGPAALAVNRRDGVAYHSSAPSRLSAWRGLGVMAFMGSLIALVLAPWALRNQRILHRLIWTDTNAGITLYDGYNPAATGASHQNFRTIPELSAMDEIQRSDYLMHKAIEFIRRAPLRAVELDVAKAAQTWSPVPLSDQFGKPAYRAILFMFALPLDLLVILGLWRGSLSRSAKVFLLVPAIYLTAIHALTIGSLRYRLPAEPALAVLAGCAIAKREVPDRRYSEIVS